MILNHIYWHCDLVDLDKSLLLLRGVVEGNFPLRFFPLLHINIPHRWHLLGSPCQLSRQKGAASHDPVHVIPSNVEIGHSTSPSEFYGRNVIGLSCLLLSAKCAEIKIFIPCNSAYSSLPSSMLMVPSNSSVYRCSP
uniref:Uncharacterized protein n=1 Tax=Opuntia streptacantha TaxID=393608 RepID=A0A7C9EEK8_OPUST